MSEDRNLLDDVAAGHIERGALKIKETATVEKFLMTDNGPVLFEVVTAERRIDTNTDDHGWTVTARTPAAGDAL